MSNLSVYWSPVTNRIHPNICDEEQVKNYGKYLRTSTALIPESPSQPSVCPIRTLKKCGWWYFLGMNRAKWNRTSMIMVQFSTKCSLRSVYFKMKPTFKVSLTHQIFMWVSCIVKLTALYSTGPGTGELLLASECMAAWSGKQRECIVLGGTKCTWQQHVRAALWNRQAAKICLSWVLRWRDRKARLLILPTVLYHMCILWLQWVQALVQSGDVPAILSFLVTVPSRFLATYCSHIPLAPPASKWLPLPLNFTASRITLSIWMYFSVLPESSCILYAFLSSL